VIGFVAALNRLAIERKEEWARVEREHMSECAERYKLLTDRPDSDPATVGAVKHH
jgi:hypothetical protein